jgi:putative ABC transport system permease protein
VAKDFHVESLQEAIKPAIFTVGKSNLAFALVRVRPANLAETIASLQAQWQALLPNHPFQYYFLDADFGRLYEKERRLGQIVGSFAFLAIFIAGLGLLGMASFVAQQRTKEIAVRKVLGASVAGVITLLTKDFLKLIVLAFLLAAPMGYLAMRHWLQDFAYRIDLGAEEFVFAGGVLLLITLVTVSSLAVKAALANPVEALRNE